MRGAKLLIIAVLLTFLFGFFSKLIAAPLPKEVNIFYPHAGYDIALIKNFESDLGVKFNGAKWYLNWETDFTQDVAKNFSSSGYLPELTWEPMIGGKGVKYTDVTSGVYDSYLENFALDVKAFGKPIRIVLAPEMNTDWTPWGYQLAGNTDITHKAFWKYIVNKFRSAGATNAKWVWAPNVIPYGAKYSYAQMYPGDSYVDFTGLEGYNWGTSRSWSVWQSFDEVFYSSYKSLTAVTSKKILITEIGSTEQGGSKAAWFEDMGKVLRSKYPQVQGFTWFNYKKETDWRINSSESAKKAFIAMVKGSSATTAPTPPQSPPTNSTSNSSNQTDNTIFSGKTEPSPNNKTESPTIPKVTATNPENNILNPVLIADLPEPENKITESIYVSRSYLDKASDPEQIALAIIGLCTLLLVILLGVGGVLHTHKHFKSRRNQQNYHKLKTQKARIQKQIDALTRKLSEIESKLEN